MAGKAIPTAAPASAKTGGTEVQDAINAAQGDESDAAAGEASASAEEQVEEEDAEDTAGEADEHADAAEDADAEEATESKAKGKRVTFDEAQQEVLNKRVGEVTAKRREAERQAEEFKTKAEETAKELETLRSKAVADLGIVAEFIPSKEDAAIVQKARVLRGQLTFLEHQEDNPDGYNGPDANGTMVAWPQSEVRRMLRGAWREYDDLSGDAKAIEREANLKLNEVLAVGKAALKAGWKPGQPAAAAPTKITAKAIPTGVRTGGAPAGTTGGAGKGASVTRVPSRGSDSLPTTREDLAESLGASLMSTTSSAVRRR